ncbi:AAA family ATPase [Desulfonema magnum]|uniref:Cobyrinic acid ac-diamide synthase n=1 Tax=Desulfonema magnum TaxID=45655 RepID=A0A975BMM2_9BACT|nr:AAA family ATPase [Desulfonema magnum]QTA88504.1 putative cobyrinic acid ac-diamide synthase [Desulfonema magnum]
MPFSIALAGKGGTGKTTIAGMLIKYMIMKEKKPILAVDADSNANLNEVLGVKIIDTIGNAREDMKKGKVPSGMTKDIFISMRLEEALTETDNFDLIVMGQPEGQGCYCAANSLLTGFLEKLTANYPYIVMDNEAGMEHISRLTTRNVDVLLIVSDTSRRGLQAATRIHKLSQELNIGANKSHLIINQAKNGPSDMVLDILDEAGLNLAGTVPEDDTLYEYDLNGRPTIEMPEDNDAVKAAFGIFDKIIN